MKLPDMKENAPNILLIVADDLTSYMMGCAGSDFYETPNLDRLAASGVHFDAAYGTGPVCSPSRASLMTGKHPARLHLTNFTPGSVKENAPLKEPDWTPFLRVEEHTLGDHYKRLGYRTGHFGKWHLNRDYRHTPGRPMDPESQGFDEVFLTWKPKPDADPTQDAHNARAITEKAVDFMERRRSEPFLCVVEHNLIHHPEMEVPELVEKYSRKPGSDRDYQRPKTGAMVERLDWSVGVLVDAVKRLGLEENTLIVFTADHGAHGPHTQDRPLRAAKASLYEGGIRVPLIVSWAGRVTGGRRVEVPVTGADVGVALLQLGNDPVPPEELDGFDLWPLLLPDGSGTLPDRDLYWHFPHYHHNGIAPCGAIRSGRWKLIEWFEPALLGKPAVECLELYDLETDPRESRNLYPECREVAARLHAALRAWREEVGAQEMTINEDFQPDQPQEFTVRKAR